MADEKKPTYPFVSRKNWFALRKQFIRTVPTSVTPSYIAGVLNLDNVESARANVFRGLTLSGLVDKDNKPTQLALRWRDDDQYAKVCEEIRQAIYPDELKDVAPDANTPIEQVEKWFRNKGLGESAAQKYASFYLLLCEADPTKEGEGGRMRTTPSPQRGTRKPKQATNGSKAALPAVVERSPSPVPVADVAGEQPNEKKARPSLHIDIQIHISPEATADQIEHIFASMAKHLKDI